MALLQRVRIIANERLDLPDFNRIEDFICADFKAIHKKVLADENFVLQGFVATGTGTNTLSIELADSAAIIGGDDGVLYIGAPSLSPLATSSLSPGTTNYIEIYVDQDTGGADSRAFWDPTAAGGVGAEFSQIVDTFTFLKAVLSVSTSNFSGDPDKAKICEVDVNGSGVITAIRDSRDLYFRLGRGNDPTHSFPWSSRVEPVSTQFTGADKDIKSQKELNDALMDSIREIKGTAYWFEVALLSLPGLSSFNNSVIAPFSSGAKVSWSGSVLSITDSSGTPADADVIAKIRLFGRNQQLDLTRQDGTGGSTTIAIADGEVLFLDIPSSGDQAYSGVGALGSNYQTVPFASFVQSDANYWLAYRAGSKLLFRGNGELQAGEDAEIGDNIPQTLLDNLGLVDETTAATYSSDIRGTASESLVARLGVLTDAIGDEQEDRSAFLRSDDEVLWDGTQLSFASNIILEILNTKSGVETLHSILVADSPITINDGESVYIEIDRTQASESVSPVRSSITPIPPQTQSDKDIFVLFKRIDAGGVKYLHLPFIKQLVSEGTSFRLGQAGSSTGVVKVTLHDALSTTLPTGPTVSIDNVAGADDDLVLFTNLSSGNNQVYKLSGVGVSIAWTAVNVFSGSVTPSDADLVVVQNGSAFGNQVGQFVDSAFKFNDTIRLFNGTDFWEMSSLQTASLSDNTTSDVFSVTAAGSENFIVNFSILRNGNKETGTLWITSDGINASVSGGGTYLALTGIEFTADISAGNLRLRYTSSSTGFGATMKYFTQRWSDTPGGPSSLVSYSPFIATVNNSAFLMSDNSGTPYNCSPAVVVLGKTRVTLGFAFLVGANAGSTVGDLEIFVNGQRFPRFLSGVTVDGYYQEISSTLIEFSADLSGSPLSIEFVKRV